MGAVHPTPVPYLKSLWVSDAERPHCYRCHSTFTTWLRRHHCRCCGEIFCHWCWGTTVSLPKEYGHTGTVKVCTSCETLVTGKLACLLTLRTVTVTRRLKVDSVLTEKCSNLTKKALSGGSAGTAGGLTSSPGNPLSRVNRSKTSEESVSSGGTLCTVRITRWRPLNARTALALEDVEDTTSPTNYTRRCSDLHVTSNSTAVALGDIVRVTLMTVPALGSVVSLETQTEVLHLQVVVCGEERQGGGRYSAATPETHAFYLEMTELVNMSKS